MLNYIRLRGHSKMDGDDVFLTFALCFLTRTACCSNTETLGEQFIIF